MTNYFLRGNLDYTVATPDDIVAVFNQLATSDDVGVGELAMVYKAVVSDLLSRHPGSLSFSPHRPCKGHYGDDANSMRRYADALDEFALATEQFKGPRAEFHAASRGLRDALDDMYQTAAGVHFIPECYRENAINFARCRCDGNEDYYELLKEVVEIFSSSTAS